MTNPRGTQTFDARVRGGDSEMDIISAPTELPEITNSPNPLQYKRYLLSLNGSKLDKHLRKEKNRPENGKKAISTDLTYWMHEDQEKFNEML